MNLKIHFDLFSNWMYKMTDQSSSSLWKRPGTRLSWWAVGFGAASLVMLLINVAVAAITRHPAWTFLVNFMLLCALVAGVIGIIAIILKHEHSWLVWLTILPGVWSLSYLLNSPVLSFLMILILVTAIVGFRAKTLEFKHYFMFGVISGFIGVILKVWSWNQESFLNRFAEWGIVLWWWFIPIVVFVSAWIGAWISIRMVSSKDTFIDRLLAFVFAILISFSLCFFGFAFAFSL